MMSADPAVDSDQLEMSRNTVDPDLDRISTDMIEEAGPEQEEMEAGALAHVLFFNNHKSRAARQLLEDYIIKLCSSNSAAEVQDDLVGQADTADVTGSITYYKSFCVDILGHPMKSSYEEAELPLSARVSYAQVYLDPFWIHPVVEQEEKRLRRMAIRCFNCGDAHHLDDCPLPKDMARIFQQRQTFRASFGPVGADSRYHLSSTDKQHSQFCPGQISDKLRCALNLSPEDYPPYISRMLIHGYPPGYRLLEEENYLTLIDDPAEGSNKPTSYAVARRNLEIIYPGFNDKSHSGALDLKIHPVTTATTCNSNTVTVKSSIISLDEELGSTPDYYELEEGELEGGEQVVRLKFKEGGQPKNNFERKCFSLDFPPGRVHLDPESQSTPGQTWETIKTLLANRKKLKTM